MRHRRGFTLVELLVVIGIIAVLVGVLLPVLGKVRRDANRIKCKSNLSQIFLATKMYANDNRDYFPDGHTLGGWHFRMRRGMTNADDPYSAPETLGLPALYRERKYLVSDEVWMCPSASEEMSRWGNTYAWFLLGGWHVGPDSAAKPANANVLRLNHVGRNGQANEAKWTTLDRGKRDRDGIQWVRDNTDYMPFTPTAVPRNDKGEGSQYPVARRPMPHDFRSKNFRGRSRQLGSVNILFLDGHVGDFVFVNSGQSEVIRGGG